MIVIKITTTPSVSFTTACIIFPKERANPDQVCTLILAENNYICSEREILILSQCTDKIYVREDRKLSKAAKSVPYP